MGPSPIPLLHPKIFQGICQGSTLEVEIRVERVRVDGFLGLLFVVGGLKVVEID